MKEWKRDIREITKGFNIPKAIYYLVIDTTEMETKHKETPSYYTLRNDFLYDVAYRKLKPFIRKAI